MVRFQFLSLTRAVCVPGVREGGHPDESLEEKPSAAPLVPGERLFSFGVAGLSQTVPAPSPFASATGVRIPHQASIPEYVFASVFSSLAHALVKRRVCYVRTAAITIHSGLQ